MAFPPVQSVVRAVALLKALNRQPVSTLDQLHRQTQLPKPSIVRLLQTLGALGLVRQGPQHGSYVLTSEVRNLATGLDSDMQPVPSSAPLVQGATTGSRDGRGRNALPLAERIDPTSLPRESRSAAALATGVGRGARAPSPSRAAVPDDDPAGTVRDDDASARRGAEPPTNLEQIDTSLVESFIGYSARRASLAIVETFMERMAVHQLRPVNFTLLGLIAANPGIMSSQLCALLKIQSSNLVALVKDLHGRKLIERQAHPNDVRAWGLHLTPKGHRFLQKAQSTALDAGLEATARLTDEERATLAALLRKIYQ